MAMPDTKQLPDFMHADVTKAWQTAAGPSRAWAPPSRPCGCPTGTSTCRGRPARSSRRRPIALHRDYIEDMTRRSAPACAPAPRPAKSFVPGAYAEEMRGMSERRRAFNEWLRRLRRDPAADHGDARDPRGEVDETSPIPGFLTRPGNYLGLCGLAMPAGQSGGLPIGVQIVGKPFAERDVLRLGKAFQDATDFHRRAPDLSALGLSQARLATSDFRHSRYFRQRAWCGRKIGPITSSVGGVLEPAGEYWTYDRLYNYGSIHSQVEQYGGEKGMSSGRRKLPLSPARRAASASRRRPASWTTAGTSRCWISWATRCAPPSMPWTARCHLGARGRCLRPGAVQAAVQQAQRRSAASMRWSTTPASRCSSRCWT